jgi:3-oxoacyl-[acyl-carrier protein] reductase
MQRLEGRSAIVVGGSGGIGAACARLLAQAGARVAITHTARSGDKASAVIASMPGAGHLAFVAEVTDTASLLEMRSALQAQWGEKLHILVNAAGFTKAVVHENLDALDDGLIDDVFRVNWRGQFAAIRTFAPLLKASGDGLIVNISSIAGQTGVGSSIAYCAAKAGIDVMTKSLGRALAPEVRVLGVAPGVVDTAFVPGRTAEMNAKIAAGTPLRRVASVEDIAQAVLACATSLLFSTGTTLVVDGGRSL